MMKTLTLAFLAALSVATGCATHASEPSAAPGETIRSTAELNAYLQATPDSPLNHLTPDARESFLANLVFGERGLASFRYTDLQALPPDEVLEVLALFGVEHNFPTVMKGASAASHKGGPMEMMSLGDHEGYYCERPGTCAKDTGSICTSNC